MIIFLAGYQVYLARSKKMYTVTLDRKCIEVDHMVSGTIHENAYFVIGMAVRLFCFVRVMLILDGLSFYFTNMKGDLLITPRKFIYMDVSEHISKYSKKDALLTKHLQADQFSVEKF